LYKGTEEGEEGEEGGGTVEGGTEEGFSEDDAIKAATFKKSESFTTAERPCLLLKHVSTKQSTAVVFGGKEREGSEILK